VGILLGPNAEVVSGIRRKESVYSDMNAQNSQMVRTGLSTARQRRIVGNPYLIGPRLGSDPSWRRNGATYTAVILVECAGFYHQRTLVHLLHAPMCAES